MEPNLNEVPHTEGVSPSPKKDGGIGPVIGIVIVIIVLILGGVYYFTTGVNQIRNEQAPVDSAVEAENDAAALREQGTSSDISSIEADIDATDLSGLDDTAANFESELLAQ